MSDYKGSVPESEALWRALGKKGQKKITDRREMLSKRERDLSKERDYRAKKKRKETQAARDKVRRLEEVVRFNKREQARRKRSTSTEGIPGPLLPSEFRKAVEEREKKWRAKEDKEDSNRKIWEAEDDGKPYA